MTRQVSTTEYLKPSILSTICGSGRASRKEFAGDAGEAESSVDDAVGNTQSKAYELVQLYLGRRGKAKLDDLLAARSTSWMAPPDCMVHETTAVVAHYFKVIFRDFFVSFKAVLSQGAIDVSGYFRQCLRGHVKDPPDHRGCFSGAANYPSASERDQRSSFSRE